MSFFQSLLARRKPTDYSHQQQNTLKRCLGPFDLTLLGIGAVIGAGVFVITGVAAATQAGPAIIISYIIAAIACGFSALSYAELSSSVGGCGSAYGYTYVGLGELLAWIIGWDLLLEYGLATSSVAVGWAGYLVGALHSVGIDLPANFVAGPFEHGIINLPATLLILAITGLLAMGTQQSARFNGLFVAIKVATIVIFIVAAGFHFDVQNWHPFMPFGFNGVVSGAALIFFAFIGFDAVSTAAEEAINPQRNLPIGILASLFVCTLLYILVAGLLTGMMPYTLLNVSSPVADALIHVGNRVMAGIISVGAIAGLTTVCVVMFYGLTRIFLAMSRDGLVPSVLARINPKTQTPTTIIVIVGVFMAILGGLVPIQQLAELVNIGTLAAFTLVCASIIILRYTNPNLPRPFKTPFAPLIPALGIGLNIYLMISLPKTTWVSFIVWMIIGLVIYYAYSRKRSIIGKLEQNR